MQPALDRNTLDRLISLGRKQGYLTNGDLQANLPIDSMSSEAIAMIVVHLEETGVPVELEDNLLSPNPRPAAPPTRSAEIIPFPSRSAAPAKPRPTPLQTGVPEQPEPSRTDPQPVRWAHWTVAISGLLVLAVMGGTLVVLGT